MYTRVHFNPFVYLLILGQSNFDNQERKFLKKQENNKMINRDRGITLIYIMFEQLKLLLS